MLQLLFYSISQLSIFLRLASLAGVTSPPITKVMRSILSSAILFFEIRQKLKFQHSQMIKHNYEKNSKNKQY